MQGSRSDLQLHPMVWATKWPRKVVFCKVIGLCRNGPTPNAAFRWEQFHLHTSRWFNARADAHDSCKKITEEMNDGFCRYSFLLRISFLPPSDILPFLHSVALILPGLSLSLFRSP